MRCYNFLTKGPFFLLAIFFIFLPYSSVKAEVKENSQIRVGIWENNPLVYIGTPNKAMGLFPVVMDYIAEKEAWDIVYVQGNFPELMEELKKNTIDALLTGLKSNGTKTYAKEK